MASPALALLQHPLRGQGGLLIALWSAGIYAMLVLYDVSRLHAGVHALTTGFLLIVWLLGFGVLQHHAWATFRHAAGGHEEAIRDIDIRQISPLANPLCLQVALLLTCIAGAIAWVASASVAGGAALAVIAGGIVPAVLGVMILDERFLSGLDAKRDIDFLVALGADYVVFALLLLAGTATLYAACFAVAPPQFATVLIAAYVLVLAHVAAGRIVHRRRGRLPRGLAPIAPAGPDRGDPAIEALMMELHRLGAADRIDEAGRRIDEFLRGSDLAFEEHVHRRLALLHDPRLSLEHNRRYLNRLIAARKLPRAWLLLRDSLDRDPAFRPEGADALALLIQAAPPADARHVEMLGEEIGRAEPTALAAPTTAAAAKRGP